MGIVFLLCFTIAPIPPGILMAFFIGGVLLILGMMFFTLGAEMAMTPMGERIGMRLTQMKSVWVVVLQFYSGIYHHYLGAGSASAGRAGAVGA